MKKNNKKYYAAYGSNMNLEQMAFRCPDSKVVGTGYIPGWKLYFNIHADIKYTGLKDDLVPIVIWDIAPQDWKMLDRYEGFPVYYEKGIVACKMDSGDNYTDVDCIVYIMTDENADGYRLPLKQYLRTIAVGYNEHNIDTKFLIEALTYTAENETEIFNFDSEEDVIEEVI